MHAPAPHRVTCYGMDVDSKRVVVCHCAYVHATPGRKLDIPPGPRVDLKNLERRIPFVKLKLRAENSAVVQTIEKPYERFRRRLELLQRDAHHQRTVSQLWRVHAKPTARKQGTRSAMPVYEAVQEVMSGGRSGYVLLQQNREVDPLRAGECRGLVLH